jgi:hypothetical protein
MNKKFFYKLIYFKLMLIFYVILTDTDTHKTFLDNSVDTHMKLKLI